MPSLASISDLIKRAALIAGFDLAGIAPVHDFPELDYFPRWLEEGYGGEMRYLKARNQAGELKRASLHAVAPWVRSVIVCAINYNTDQPYSIEPSALSHQPSGDVATTAAEGQEPTTHDQRPSSRGWISRYAWAAEDYHESVMRRLRQLEARIQQEHPGAKTRCYVDTGPVLERVFAKYAGVGWLAKNTCIIHQQLGSWLFLGVVLTSLQLEPDLPAPDRCGSCTRCLDACPTDAFIAPYELDASRCISYLTIEKRGAIPQPLRPGIGRNVFGCDICQDVCPWNRKAPASPHPEFRARPELVNPALDWLAALDEPQFRAMFRGSAIRRTKFAGWRRNVAIAMGNSGDPRFRPALEKLAADADPVVAEHARWALGRLAKAGDPT